MMALGVGEKVACLQDGWVDDTSAAFCIMVQTGSNWSMGELHKTWSGGQGYKGQRIFIGERGKNC